MNQFRDVAEIALQPRVGISFIFISSHCVAKYQFRAGKVPALLDVPMANLREQRLGTTAIILLALSPLGLCQMNCDIESCSFLFQSTFSDLLSNGLENVCRNIMEILKCVNDCHKTFFPHFISTNSTTYFLNKICDGDFIYDITDDNWKCIRQHFNRLLACVASSSSMESLHHKHDNTKLLSCKKILAILDCPQDILYNQCEDHVVEAVSEAFRVGLKPVLETSCLKITYNKASNLDVQPLLDTGYHKGAVCMDNYEDLAQSCFNEYLNKAAHFELNNCSSEDAETICNKPSSSIPCSPLSFVSNFYSTVFSYGKQECNNSVSNIHQLKPRINASPKTTGIEIHEDVSEKAPFMKDAILNLSRTSTEESGTFSTLEEFTVSSFPEDISSSTKNFQTDDTNILEYDFMYPSSSTWMPDNMNGEAVLSDAPRNISNTHTEGRNNGTPDVKNFTISNNYHTSCGSAFVSFAYIFFAIGAILL